MPVYTDRGTRVPVSRLCCNSSIAARILALLLAVLVAAGCAGGADDDDEDSSAAPAVSWPGPPRAGRDGQVSVAAFNRYAEQAAGRWRRSPVTAAARFVGLPGRTAEHIALVASSRPPEGANTATVVVTLSGLADDSIAGERYRLRFGASGGAWRLVSASWSQRCQPGRGHGSYSPAPCL